jgi:hypothetical protein
MIAINIAANYFFLLSFPGCYTRTMQGEGTGKSDWWRRREFMLKLTTTPQERVTSQQAVSGRKSR